MITLESSLFYLSVIIISYFFAYLAEKSNRGFLAGIYVLIYSIVAGCRAYTVGVDTHNYVILFEHPKWFPVEKEIGFSTFNRFVMNLTNNSSFLFFCYALIIYGLVVFRLWEMRDKISFSCASMTFIAMNFFESMNVMRQYVAVAIVFFATRYLAKGKYIIFSALVLLASTFHTSALLGIGYLGIELLFWNSISKKRRAFLTFMVIIGICLVPFVISETNKYVHYFSNVTINVGFRVMELLFVWFIALIYLKGKGKKKLFPFSRQEDSYFIRTAQCYYLIGCLIWIIGYFFSLMNRLAYYYIMYVCVLFGIIIKRKGNHKLIKFSLNALIILLVIYMLLNYVFISNGPEQHPYHFIWSS